MRIHGAPAVSSNESSVVHDAQVVAMRERCSTETNVDPSPAALGANDGRVAPWQSRKMIAALQAANSGSAPILLQTSDTSGHGFGTNKSERIDKAATLLAFFRTQLQ